jgi:hypothetical protein
MTVKNQILYCIILAGSVTGGVSLLHQEAKEQENTVKRIAYSLLHYGIPWAIVQFVLFQFLTTH